MPPESKKPQFVVLHHEMPATSNRASHWDLMLERNGVLATWALDQEPTATQTGNGIAGSALPDHRKDYLEYEGPVSNDRGHVTRWDRGVYVVESETKDELVVELFGEQLNGTFELTRNLAQSDSSEAWTFRAKK